MIITNSTFPASKSLLLSHKLRIAHRTYYSFLRGRNASPLLSCKNSKDITNKLTFIDTLTLAIKALFWQNRSLIKRSNYWDKKKCPKIYPSTAFLSTRGMPTKKLPEPLAGDLYPALARSFSGWSTVAPLLFSWKSETEDRRIHYRTNEYRQRNSDKRSFLHRRQTLRSHREIYSDLSGLAWFPREPVYLALFSTP